MRKFVLVLLLALSASPTFAQQAPNRQSVVQGVIERWRHLACDETERGQIVNTAARILNNGGTTPWGRKARQDNPANPDLNTDALTFKRDDGRFEIYDVISGVPPCNSSWDGGTPVRPGENGFWWEPGPSLETSGGGGGGTGGGGGGTNTELAELKALLVAFFAQLNAHYSNVEQELRTLRERQDAQTEALNKAISELRAEIARGIKIRF
jgi:hypothetical protein